MAVVDTMESNPNGVDTRITDNLLDPVELLELPSTLREVAIPVGDGSEKPLFLLTLMDSELALNAGSSDTIHGGDSHPGETSDINGQSSTLNGGNEDVTSGNSMSRVLVFTNNNEDAMRLSHIISSMRPEMASRIGTLTKTTSKSGRKTLSAFKAGKISLLIASDRASRGLDVPDLTDVVSYDMPRNETLYIHRVGRTARAGNFGTAWTFFSDTEARWFWRSIARTSSIQRHQKQVERRKLRISESAGLKSLYESALESLKEAVIHNSK